MSRTDARNMRELGWMEEGEEENEDEDEAVEMEAEVGDIMICLVFPAV